MKKRLNLFCILALMIFTIILSANIRLYQTVQATYVEGLITQDTIWTLTDSPFVVSKNITVYPNATLTIEPGVQVRFGGPFSLIIQGKMYADGTEKPIEFTSNSEQPSARHWNSLIFNGIQKSILTECLIAHATIGILAENSDVEIRNSNITLCSTGITAINSKLTIQDNTIMGNGDNGIVITGNNQVTIQRNTIIANGNGILLTGNETSTVNINQNIISANTQNGIQIDATDHSNLIIIHNNISSNLRGFYISSPTSTYITNNSISYNKVGIFYALGNHTASYNDIYHNTLGMDIGEGNIIVNAEYNYWGHETGPYHQLLNPSGKGNPIGSNGVDLDFIFFLTEPFGYINSRPTATLLTDKTIVPPNEKVMFFATNSFDEGRVDKYLFNFGDGKTSGWTTLSIFTHKYASLGIFNPSLIVMDDFGAISTNNPTATIYVQNLSSLHVNVHTSGHAVYEGEQILVTVHVTNETASIENASIKMISLNGGDFTDSIGDTNSTGYFTTVFTAPDVAYTTNIRIIATASKNGYADGSDYKYLESLPSLTVQITADPATVKSEEKTQITVYVKSDEQTVSNAAVSVSASNGNLSTTTGTTNSDGLFLLDFTAPQTITLLSISITASAEKTGYMSSTGQAVITVEPKVLVVSITAEPSTTISDATVDVTVHVEYGTAISNANVTLTSETFSATGLTNAIGDVKFTLTAPQVNESSNITLTAKASKSNYANGQSQLQITVNPGQLNIQLGVTESILDSEGSTIILVYVTCNNTPVKDALVTMSSNHGSFPVSTNLTDSQGYCKFVFNAPRTNVQLNATITANATKNGYISEENQITLTVSPETGGGWSLITILLIIIPIVIVVIVAVLIKLKVITLSAKGAR